MKSKACTFLPWLVILPLLWNGCDYDHGIDPIRTKIKGAVIFVGGPPESYVREARVAVAKKFPPENLATDLIYSDPLVFIRDTSRVEPDTVRYELVAEPGTYAAAGVLWRKSGESWDVANILGIYTIPGQLSPAKVVISADRPVADSVNIFADWALAKRDAIISGKIAFKNKWPEDTEIVALAYFPIIPREQIDFLTVKALDINVPLFRENSYDYRTAVSSGEYKFIALFWKGRTTSIFDIRAIGFYHCEKDSLLPQAVAVEKDQTKSGVDFEVDFSTLPHGVNFRKDGAPCPQ
jgi:hypothetical protein